MKAIKFINYLMGDEEGGSLRSLHSEKWYIGESLTEIFEDILKEEKICQGAGYAYKNMFKASITGEIQNQEKRDRINRAFSKYNNFFTFVIEEIETEKATLKDLKGLLIKGLSDSGYDMVYYQITDVTDDPNRINKIKEHEGMFFEHRKPSFHAIDPSMLNSFRNI